MADNSLITKAHLRAAAENIVEKLNDLDVTYSEATTSVAGLMSAADKKKLDGITASADAVSVSQSLTSGTQVGTITINGTATKLYAPTNTDTTYSAATTSAAGLMSAADKTKLDGIATGANAYTHPTTSGNKHIPSGGSSGQILRWSADGTAAWGADNNTTYSAATTSAAGLMSATDKTKLDGIASGATANAGTITGVTAGNGLTGGGTSGSVTLNVGAGTGISVAADTISLATCGTAGTYGPTANVSGANGNTIKVPQITTDAYGRVTAVTERTYTSVNTDTNTTYSAATTSAAGLMSAADKTKLDAITASADAVSFSQSLTSGTQVGTITINGTATKLYAPTDTNTTYSAATTSTAGLMSAADKTKLDGITSGANSYTHPSYTARTGVPTANATLSFGGTFNVTQPVSDASGHITAMNSRTYTMPSDRLFTTLTPSGTAIGSNADLNTTDYIKVGRYYCSSNATAATLTNCPLSTAFMMEVYSPLSTTIDNETTATYVYRLRKITAYRTGVQYIQYVNSSSTAGTFTYDSWYVVPRSPFVLDSSDTNGGSATLGSATQPVYVASDGTLTKCTYTLGASVPSGAKFTDTTYSAATTSAAGLMSAADKTKLDGISGVHLATASSSDGVTYTATVNGITSLTAGLMVVFISSKTSASTAPTLNINSLGAKTIKRRLSNLSSTTTSGLSNNWLYASKPQLMMYDGSYWIVVNQDKPAAGDLYGTAAIANGGTGATTAAAALTNLGAAAAEHDHKGGALQPAYLEFFPGSSAGHGGYLDFHYNDTTDDYSVRLISGKSELLFSGGDYNGCALLHAGNLSSYLSSLGGAKIATGSYTGTGKYGSSNKNSLTLDFEPKLVIIHQNSAMPGAYSIFVNGSGYATHPSSTGYPIYLTWSGTTVSWYHTQMADYQLNASKEYAYVAIG